MHAHAGELKLKGVKQGDLGTFEVQHFMHSVSHPIDSVSGMSSGKIRGNILELDLDIEDSCMLILNAVTSNEVLSGELKFFKPDASGKEAVYYTIKIENASCFSFEQIFSSGESTPMRIHIKISSAKMEFTIGGKMAQYENDYHNS